MGRSVVDTYIIPIILRILQGNNMKIYFYTALYQALLKEANEKGVSIPILVVKRLEDMYGITNKSNEKGGTT